MFIRKVNVLWTGTQLFKGQALVSDNRRFKAILEDNGDFVLYSSDPQWWSIGSSGFYQFNTYDKVLWRSDTADRGGTRLVMETDGDLVLLDQIGKHLWIANKNQTGEWTRLKYLVCQNDGNLVMYNSKNNPIWMTYTNYCSFC